MLTLDYQKDEMTFMSGRQMGSLFGDSGIVKNKKIGVHFDDVLLHDVY